MLVVEKKPTVEEWKKLYAVVGQVKELAPWKWMAEEQVFGVRNPESDEIGFVSVMGAAGEHFAVAVYPGAEALYGFLSLHYEGMEGLVDDIAPSSVMELLQIQASFEDRGRLQKEDRDIIKKLNLKFRGANNWPLFRSYTPGMLPWFLTASEARFLTTALEQSLDVAPRVRDDKSILPRAISGDFMVRVPHVEKARFVWEDKMMRVPKPEKKPATPAPLDPQLIEALKGLPKKGMALEMELTMLPFPTREKKGRPFFPYLLLIVESQSGFILNTDLLQPQPSLKEMWDSIPLKLAEAMSQLGGIPNVVAVRAETTASLLAPLAAELGIQLEQSPKLPALDAALKVMDRISPF